VERRLSDVEHDSAPEEWSPERSVESDEPRSTGLGLSSFLTLSGRSLLVLGGAFLLRALTEENVLSPTVGIIAGLAYASLWIGLLVRAGRRGKQASPIAHGLTAALIGFPLVLETVTRLEILTAAWGAVALIVFAGIGFAAAWGTRIRTVAWVFSLGATATAWLLMIRTTEIIPMATALLVLGLTTLWLAYRRGWPALRWFFAFQADVALALAIVLFLRGAAGSPEADPGILLALCALFGGGYLISFLVRTLVHQGKVTPFEVVQSFSVILVAFGGAALLSQHLETAPWAAGGAAMLFALGSYVIAFTHADRRRTQADENFYYFGWLAVGFAHVGVFANVHGVAATLVLCGLALASTVLGSRFRRMTLRHHAAVYLTAAAIQGGAFDFAFRMLFTPATVAWPPPTPQSMAVFGTAALCYVLLASTQGAHPSGWLRLAPRLVTGLISGLGAAGLLVLTASRLLTVPPPDADPAVLAMVRTAVLAVLAIILAIGGRRSKLIELMWLAHPTILALTAKFMFEDFPNGRPVTLFVSLVFYGAALIVASRCLRARQQLGVKATEAHSVIQDDLPRGPEENTSPP